MENHLDIKYEKYLLENGLEVVLVPITSFPNVTVNIWYKVGSANEKLGKTGFAHLFEHMMFQGSENVEKEKHFKYIQEVGGNLNGSTSMDRTNYYETVPPNALELALWLESDRMGFLLPSLTEEKLANQKDVVMNERRQNYDNQPYGLAWEILFKNLFPSNHPYHWPTIGFMDDIEKINLDDVHNFFRRYYAPGNASLVIAGNFYVPEAKQLVDKYFSKIENNNSVPTVNPDRIKFNESKKIVHKDKVQLERIYLAWHSDKAYGEYDAALDILADILAGSKNARLQKKLVHDLALVQDVSTFQFSGKYNGVFFIMITLKPGTAASEIREYVENSIKELAEEGITDKELIRSKNSFKSSFIYSLQNLENLANQINSYNVDLNNPNSLMFDLERYQKLQKEDIKNAAEIMLLKPNVELLIVPQNK